MGMGISKALVEQAPFFMTTQPRLIPLPQRWRFCSNLRCNLEVIPRSAPFQRRSISRVK
jgi:hypothetical protein